MVVGYCRVSTDKQDAARQKADIRESAEKAKLVVDSWVEETVSSRKADREVFQLVEGLGAGDTIITTELSRLGRSLREINELVNGIVKHGATLITVSDSERYGQGMGISAECKLFAIGLAAQLERDSISERTKSGLRAARASGKTLGRPAGKSKLDPKAQEIQKYLGLRISKADIARLVGCSRQALATWLSRHAA